MTNFEEINKERLKNSIEKCRLHIKRILFANSQIVSFFPLTIEKYNNLSEIEIGHIDQLIYRFSKLQDELGNNTFRFLLIDLKEDIENKPFKDILNKLEQLRILDSADNWMELRELRNNLAHEYPVMVDESIDKLNYLSLQVPKILRIFDSVEIHS